MIATLNRHPRLTIGLTGASSFAILAELFHLFRADLRIFLTRGS